MNWLIFFMGFGIGLVVMGIIGAIMEQKYNEAQSKERELDHLLDRIVKIEKKNK